MIILMDEGDDGIIAYGFCCLRAEFSDWKGGPVRSTAMPRWMDGWNFGESVGGSEWSEVLGFFGCDCAIWCLGVQ